MSVPVFTFEMFRGEPVTFPLAFSGVNTLSGATIYFYAKLNPGDPDDSSAYIALDSVNNPANVVVVDANALTAKVVLTAEMTQHLKHKTMLYFRVWLKEPDGSGPFVTASGSIEVYV